MRNYLDDIFYWLGAALISIGTYCIYPVAALFSAGIFCLLAAYLYGKAKANQS